MQTIFYSVGLYILAFSLHILWWRVALPKYHTQALLSIFFGVLIFGILASFLPFLDTVAPATVWDFLAMILFHSAGSLAYIAFYSAIEEDSPSLTLIKAVEVSGEQGLSRQDCHAIIGDDFLLNNRLQIMVRDGLVRQEGEQFYLAAKGEQLVGLFQKAAIIWGLPRGG